MNSHKRNERISEIKTELVVSDLDMARIVDDLITTLIKTGVILPSSLSDISRAKIERRAHLREELFELCQAELEENPVTQQAHCGSGTGCSNCHSADTH